jgi:hypothetical protein
MASEYTQVVVDEWVSFPGGELEGRRPKTLCQACRDKLRLQATLKVASSLRRADARTLCFQCYRADVARERALRAAGELDTASESRFQCQLPFEPLNKARLDVLKAERAEARAASVEDLGGLGQYAARRRQAQMAARHALQRIAAGLGTRQAAAAHSAPVSASAATSAAGDCDLASWGAAVYAAELQLPESWLPFVVSR